MLDINLIDGKTPNKYAARVEKTGAVRIIEEPTPPFNSLRSSMRITRQFLTDDGTSSGDEDMRVDGSVTPVEFWYPASPDKDRYVTQLSFVISDAGATLNQFGSIGALTNGCRLAYEDEMGEMEINDSLTTNWEFVRLAGGNPAFGDGNTSFRANNVNGTSEAYIPILDLRTIFGFKWGVRLQAGTTQRIVLTVRDDVSAVDQFDCVVYGFERSNV